MMSDEQQAHETVESGSAPAEGTADDTNDIATPEATQDGGTDNGGTDNGDTAGQPEPAADAEVASGPCASHEMDMAFVAGVVKKSMFGVLCCMCFCFPVMNAVNIVAIIFAFEKFERGECPGEDICSVDCQPDAFMSMTHFLFIAGAGSLALSIAGMVAAAVFIRTFTDTVDLAVEEGSETDRFKRQADSVKKIQNLVKLLSILPTMCLQLAWSIAGIVLYTQVTSICTDTSTAKVVLAWCILTLFNVCGSCKSLVKPQDIDSLYAQLFASTNAEDATL